MKNEKLIISLSVISEQLVSRVLFTRISYNFQLSTYYLKLTTYTNTSKNSKAISFTYR